MLVQQLRKKKKRKTEVVLSNSKEKVQVTKDIAIVIATFILLRIGYIQ